VTLLDRADLQRRELEQPIVGKQTASAGVAVLRGDGLTARAPALYLRGMERIVQVCNGDATADGLSLADLPGEIRVRADALERGRRDERRRSFATEVQRRNRAQSVRLQWTVPAGP
jgi:hypothetical protein